MTTEKIFCKIRRNALRATIVFAIVGIVMAPTPASAVQSYEAVVSTSQSSTAGIHDGQLTFWTNGTDFRSDIQIWDGAPDSSGQNAYFLRVFANGTNLTRKIYWGGGYGTWGYFPNELFTSSRRVKRVTPAICLTDNGDEWICGAAPNDLNNPNY